MKFPPLQHRLRSTKMYKGDPAPKSVVPCCTLLPTLTETRIPASTASTGIKILENYLCGLCWESLHAPIVAHSWIMLFFFPKASQSLKSTSNGPYPSNVFVAKMPSCSGHVDGRWTVVWCFLYFFCILFCIFFCGCVWFCVSFADQFDGRSRSPWFEHFEHCASQAHTAFQRWDPQSCPECLRPWEV